MTSSKGFIDLICRLYGDRFDDREEDSAPGGLDWKPGQRSLHKSLTSFQKELEEQGIKISTGKIRKILITGGLWSTERSREVALLYEQYTDDELDGGAGLRPEAAKKRIAEKTELSTGMVAMLLPYDRVVYGLDDKSSNAKRCDRSRAKRKIANAQTKEKNMAD